MRGPARTRCAFLFILHARAAAVTPLPNVAMTTPERARPRRPEAPRKPSKPPRRAQRPLRQRLNPETDARFPAPKSKTAERLLSKHAPPFRGEP
ncbi:hypothetical protein WS98_28320 [Burkholderia territorii]|nr:hypothetical protein WS79_01175 [Burkholderia territorii]KVL27834.1 hypothetical protein WS98_28320 [Burkholderia territorii]